MTFFIACNLADRYITNQALVGKKPDCLMTLTVAVVLIAAKLEQPISPSFSRMIRLVKDQWGVIIRKQDVLDLEEDIIRRLDFDLQRPSPIVFV